MEEKNYKAIFKELDKLNSLGVKMRIQDKKIGVMMEKIFGENDYEKILHNTEWEDGIFAYYTNAEGYGYKEFKRLFNAVLKKELKHDVNCTKDDEVRG